jgi:glutamate formiminotransferase
MSRLLVECVPNISEGRDIARVDAVAAAVESVRGVLLLHRSSDFDHHRSVLTFAGPPEAVAEAAFRATARAAELIDLNQHHGVHPRLGALDVLPFVPLSGVTMNDCVEIARTTGARIWNELGIPVYFYEAAAMRPDRVRLEDVRRGQFEGLRAVLPDDEAKRPDFGGPLLHATAGAVIVGARKILIAYNINLESNDLQLARQIAKRIRASNGGFPGVKALAFSLPGGVQISMNITDFEHTPPHVVYREVERLAARHGVAIACGELIGLLPRRVTEMTAAALLQLADFDSSRVLENRIDDLLEE